VGKAPIGSQSDADLNKWIEQYRPRYPHHGASDPVQKEWVDFITQLHRAGAQIEAIFIKGLKPLAPS